MKKRTKFRFWYDRHGGCDWVVQVGVRGRQRLTQAVYVAASIDVATGLDLDAPKNKPRAFILGRGIVDYSRKVTVIHG